VAVLQTTPVLFSFHYSAVALYHGSASSEVISRTTTRTACWTRFPFLVYTDRPSITCCVTSIMEWLHLSQRTFKWGCSNDTSIGSPRGWVTLSECLQASCVLFCLLLGFWELITTTTFLLSDDLLRATPCQSTEYFPTTRRHIPEVFSSTAVTAWNLASRLLLDLYVVWYFVLLISIFKERVTSTDVFELILLDTASGSPPPRRHIFRYYLKDTSLCTGRRCSDGLPAPNISCA
jgi:hypothetical protein